MPVKIPDKLPAYKALTDENIFIMPEGRAQTQDIRPLKIAILNLMPAKEVTETQLLRLIGNSPLQVEAVFLRTATYEGKNTSAAHLKSFYKTFDEIRHEKFDGLIVTGAPVERLDFKEVKYWDELKMILEWADKNVFSALYICWAAQAALNYFYGVSKYELDKKVSGVFLHDVRQPHNPVVRGFDDSFYAPHSRHTEIRESDVASVDGLDILATSAEAGVYLLASRNLRHVFVTGHGEYDADTLHKEYERDVKKGLANIGMPKNYYIGDEAGNVPKIFWRSHSMLLFTNWLNYCVYQVTPYNYITDDK